MWKQADSPLDCKPRQFIGACVTLKEKQEIMQLFLAPDYTVAFPYDLTYGPICLCRRAGWAFGTWEYQQSAAEYGSHSNWQECVTIFTVPSQAYVHVSQPFSLLSAPHMAELLSTLYISLRWRPVRLTPKPATRASSFHSTSSKPTFLQVRTECWCFGHHL
jgi:hypothetical protein